MDIIIPAELTPLNAINFANYISHCSSDSKFLYDFEMMQHCHPFGLLVIASAIRSNKKRYPDASHCVINYGATQGCQFALSFGFFQSAGFDLGDVKEEHDSGYRYVPIKKITTNSLHSGYTDTTLLNEKVDRQAGLLSDILVGDQSQNVRHAVQYCFREIMRNVFEHAHTDELWVCGQYWPSRNEAEIAILDEGIGILNSLRTNSKIHVNNCLEANKLALQPGLSRTLGMKQDPFDKWQNSGYGLYVASTLSAINSGYFIISSGNSAILHNAQQQEYNSSQIGTAICINIHTNSLRNFDNMLKAIVMEGERSAQLNGEKRILTASQVTTIASMLKNIETNYQNDSSDINDALLGEDLIPINTAVLFSARSVNRQGELYGTFEYQNRTYTGSLINVSGANRLFYLRNQTPISVVIRKHKNDLYVLLEKHRYEKIVKKSK